MEDKNKDKNKTIYLVTIIVVIIVYLVIYILGVTTRKSILLENEGYENNFPKQPINNIFSILNKQDDDNNGNNDNNKGNNGNKGNDDEENIIFLYDDNGNHIELYNQFPIADEVGMSLYGDKRTQDFKLQLNSNAANVNYVVTVERLEESDFDSNYIKMYLESDGVGIKNCFRDSGRIKTFNEFATYEGNANEKVLYRGVISSEEATRGYKKFTFRMWVSEDLKIINSEYLPQTFKTVIRIRAEKK